MPKDRTVDTSFWDDPDVAKLTRDERLLMLGMMTSCADDEGRLLAEPGFLRKRVFGYDDDISKDEVQRMRDRINACCKNVTLYHADGQEYLAFLNFQKYQKIRYIVPSKLPAPPETSSENSRNEGPIWSEPPHIPENSRDLPQSSEECGNSRTPAHACGSVGLGSVGLGREDPPYAPPRGEPTPTEAASPTQTEEQEGESPAPEEAPKRRRGRAPISLCPADFAASEKDIQETATTTNLPERWLVEHTAVFVDHFRGKGEMRADWNASWRNWMRRSRSDYLKQYPNGMAPPLPAADTLHSPLSPEQQRRKREKDDFMRGYAARQKESTVGHPVTVQA